MLMATVVLSFFAALGLSLVVFELFADFPGEDPSYPLFAFIFLVALGIDYNIFLMARVREEAQTLPTEQAMLKGLAVDGRRHHLGGNRPRGHVLRSRRAAARRADPDRRHRRARRAPRHVRRALDPRPALTFSLGEKTWRPMRATGPAVAVSSSAAPSFSPSDSATAEKLRERGFDVLDDLLRHRQPAVALPHASGRATAPGPCRLERQLLDFAGTRVGYSAA